jgi:RNA polymerase sigma-70 factor, ECF subfamily
MALGKDIVVQTLLHERIRISGSVMPIVRDANTVDDLFQQVVLKALETCDHFAESDHLLAWALRTIRHRAIDLLRSRRVEFLNDDVLDLLEQQWARTSSEEMAGRVEALRQCLEKLPGRSRSLLRLRYDEGLSCTGVAEHLSHSVCAVYQSLSRVHHQLRLCIEQQLVDSGRLPSACNPVLGKALT